MTDTWHDRLRQRLRDLGWSVAELSRKSGVNQDNCYRYVDGKVDNPRGDALAKLARAMDVSEEWLRFGIDTAQEQGTSLVTGEIFSAPLLSIGAIEGALLADRSVRSAWDGVSVVPVPVAPASDLFFCQINDQANVGRFNPHDFIGFRESIPPQPGNWVVVFVYALRRIVVGKYVVLERNGAGGEVISIEPANPAEGRVKLVHPDEYRYLGKITYHLATLD